MASRGIDWAARLPKISVSKLCGTENTVHGGNIWDLACLRVPSGQHVEYSTPGFGVDAAIRIFMSGALNGCHQIPGCVRPIARTQRVGKLLQTDLANFREPGFVYIPVSLGKKVNEWDSYITVKSDANSCMMSQEWIVARIQLNASVFNSGIPY
jgi:hypothetical protein